MIIKGDCAKVLKDFDFNCIDLTVTSPPYDKLRYYEGHNDPIDIVTIAKELLRVTKRGGICVWVTNDQTSDFCETLSSFKNAEVFIKTGWKLHDTMMFVKKGTPNLMMNAKRYSQAFDYMFVFCKGFVRKFNPIKDIKNKTDGHKYASHHCRDKEDKIIYERYKRTVKPYGIRTNIWTYDVGYFKSTLDKFAYYHPAIFPESLAYDHIRSWSNEGDYVLDPFLGSGTTYKMALALNRIPIGIEINPNYIQIAKKRLNRYLEQKKNFGKLLIKVK